MDKLTKKQLSSIGARIDMNMETARKQRDSSIEYCINAGEELIQVSATVDKLSDWLESNCHVKAAQANRLIRVATHKWQARQLIRDGEATSIDSLQKCLPKTNEPVQVTEADSKQLGYVGSISSADKVKKDDWHTPAKYINAAREVMGSINLDPFSSVVANSQIQADNILTIADDAFTCSWGRHDTLWMNPPYSRGMAERAVVKSLEEKRAGAFNEAIVLMNNATDTVWCDLLFMNCSAFGFTRGRISFEDNGGKKQSSNTRGQVFFYFGDNAQKFLQVFNDQCNCNTFMGRIV